MKKIPIICSIVIFSLNVGSGCNVSYQEQTEIKVTQTASIDGSHVPEVLPTVEVQLTAQSVNEAEDLIIAPPTDTVREMIGQVNQQRILTTLRQLTGEEPLCIHNGCHTIVSRETGSEGLKWTKAYLYQELAGLGYQVVIQDWAHSGFADQNLIARKLGVVSPDEEVYVVAHIDGVTGSSAADDNASGVVDLLELARVLNNSSFSRTVVLLFTTGEEQGSLGSRSYVDQLSLEEINAISFVVDVDMIGYDSDNDGAMELWSGDHPPSLVFAQTLSELIVAHQLDLTPSIVTGCN